MNFRSATPVDIDEMSQVLKELVLAGKRSSPSDKEFVRATYVANPDGILCTVAEDDEGIVRGFQSLILASEGNRFGVEPGWGIIGTHVSPGAARRGVGKGLWQSSLLAARSADLKRIDASIGDDNAEGLAYYEAMGFRTYRTKEGTICKCYKLEA